MIYLYKESIITINKKEVESYGGTWFPISNFKNEATLDYLIETVEHGQIFGQPMYPSVLEKAALYLAKISQGHIFNDGNKRTALTSTYVFLRLNGYDFAPKLQIYENLQKIEIPAAPNHSDYDILLSLVEQVAQSFISQDDLVAWLEKNIVKI